MTFFPQIKSNVFANIFDVKTGRRNESLTVTQKILDARLARLTIIRQFDLSFFNYRKTKH